MAKMWPSRQCIDGDSEARTRSSQEMQGWRLRGKTEERIDPHGMEVGLLARTRDRGPAT